MLYIYSVWRKDQGEGTSARCRDESNACLLVPAARSEPNLLLLIVLLFDSDGVFVLL